MGYSAGFLHDVIQVLNRKEAKTSKFGIDGGGVEWEEGPCLHANVDYARGKSAMTLHVKPEQQKNSKGNSGINRNHDFFRFTGYCRWGWFFI